MDDLVLVMIIRGTRQQLSENLIILEGKPFSLHDYPPFLDVYNRKHKEVLFLAGRQVSKSTTIANLIGLDALTPHWRTLYVAPSFTQASVFSSTRLNKIIQNSPKLRTALKSNKADVNQAGHKVFGNGSEIFVSFASDDPDRIRGISANKVFYDEVQDISYDEVIPVINETMSGSKHGRLVTYAGTPKTLENTIQALWDASTQSEWLMLCEHCNKYNVPGAKNISRRGLVCANCFKDLNCRNGRWFDMRSKLVEDDADLIKGYRVPQIILPLHTESKDKWRELYSKYDGPQSYSESKFKNEILAMSDSLGSRMISREDLLALCQDYSIYEGPRVNKKKISRVFAGIDWSGEGKTQQSFTSLWIWGLNHTTYKLQTLYYHVYHTGHPLQNVDEIAKKIKEYNVDMVCGDKGGGAHAMALLREKLGDNKTVQVAYGSYRNPITWDPEGDAYLTDKTTALDNFFLAIKKGDFVFARPTEMSTAFDHYLSNYEELTKDLDGKRVWKRATGKPDDALHAAVFGWLAFKAWEDDLSFYT